MNRKLLLLGLLVGAIAQACAPMGDSLPLELSIETRDQLRQDLPALILAAALVVMGLGAAVLAAHATISGFRPLLGTTVRRRSACSYSSSAWVTSSSTACSRINENSSGHGVPAAENPSTTM